MLDTEVCACQSFEVQYFINDFLFGVLPIERSSDQTRQLAVVMPRQMSPEREREFVELHAYLDFFIDPYFGHRSREPDSSE